MTLLDDFIVRAVLAGLGVALAAAPLGCFVVWRRMAYFGDATAHASILGVALALAFSVSPFLGALIVALAMATTVSVLSGRGFARCQRGSRKEMAVRFASPEVFAAVNPAVSRCARELLHCRTFQTQTR